MREQIHVVVSEVRQRRGKDGKQVAEARFLVVDADSPSGRWVSVPVDGDTPPAAPAGAVTLRFHAAPTMRERQLMDTVTEDLAGGQARWVMLMAEREHVAATLQQQTRAALPEEYRTKEPGEIPPSVWAAAYGNADQRFRVAAERIASLLRSWAFAARWQVLAVDVPPGWEKISDVPLSDTTLSAVWEACEAAWNAADAGN